MAVSSGAAIETAAAQPPGGWSEPVEIAAAEGSLSLSTLVSDSEGGVHLLYIDRPAEMPAAICYMEQGGSGWTDPIEVILDPESGTIGAPRVAIDGSGYMHLVWYGMSNSLRYSRALLAEAGSAQGWTKPRTLGRAIPASHDLVAGAGGVLYLAYGGDTGEWGLHIMESPDGGETWSSPVLAAEAAFESAASDVRLAVDGEGRIHAAWTEYRLPNGTPPTGAYYTRSSDGGRTWDVPRQVAPERHGQIGVAALGDSEVHLVWRSSVAGDGTFHQVSLDGGETWAPPEQHDDGGGFSGLPSFGADSMGTLHYLIGPVYYSYWAAGRQGPYVDVATEPVRSLGDLSPGEQGLMAITMGNRLHVVFELDFESVWYTSLDLGVPALRPAARPVSEPAAPPAGGSETPSAEPEGSLGRPAEASVPTQIPEATLPQAGFGLDKPAARDSGAAAGVAATVLAMAAVVATRLLRGNRR